ncbi:MAG: polysaccharide deacetylase family protein [Candidatus Hodarchaeales archaeon]|jgi:predicted glycoside hydrolase/deacetylase ChbG (UPF0249 family)
MTNLSVIEKLGFSTSDKVVIFHIDDIGFSHSSNVASFECLDFGIASCGSVIVPSPWFLETAAICKNNPHYDIGVHLTLTCEYNQYRWRALSSVDPSTGLLDEERCLWRTLEEAVANVSPEAAEMEMRTQIQVALDNGIDVTHIDTHMGTVVNPKFIQNYVALAYEFNLPLFLPRLSKDDLISIGMEQHVDAYMELFTQLEKGDLPIIDHMVIDTGGDQPDKTKYYCNLFSEIKPGLTHFLFHSAIMGTELKAITPDSANWRNQDYEAFTNENLKNCVKKYDLKIIGYRKLRNLIRNTQS